MGDVLSAFGLRPVIYIDPPLWPAHNTVFSHLVSDTSLAELHSFAADAGIAFRAFDLDHYDVPASRYRDLVERGAVEVDGGTLVRLLIRSGLRIKARERSASLVHPLLTRWEALLPGNRELGAELLNRWGEPHRRYHDRRHLLAVLEAVELLWDGPPPRPLLLAAWFHDAVYRGAADDEDQSARLAAALLAPADLLILDEPTNHLDSDMVSWLEDWLRRFRGGLVMVTHDRYFLERVVNGITELSRGKLYHYEANYSKYLELKELRAELNEAIKKEEFEKAGEQ